jgi:hypothetical protein
MNNLRNNKENLRDRELACAGRRRMLPFAVEFVKFFTGFIIIVAAALLALHFAIAAM